MGVFDTYNPRPGLSCPICGTELLEWQGKDGPCALLVWQQGAAEPVSQAVDEEVRLNDDALKKFRLPGLFTIYTFDCPEHELAADCECTDGVWLTTKLGPPNARRAAKK